MKQLIILSILLLTSAPFAQAGVKFNLSTKVMGSTWNGNNTDENATFNAKSTQLSFGAGLQINRLYARFSVQGSHFNFDQLAPARDTKTTNTTVNNEIIEHSESDILVGYYFWPKISLFADIKSVANKWQSSGYESSYSSLGVGVSGFHLFKQKWMVYASAGFLLPYEVKSNDEKIADGTGYAIDGGISYSISQKFRIYLGLKVQSHSFEFDNGSSQLHNRGGLYNGLQYQF